MGSDTDRYKALSAGVVDAAIVSTEYLPIAPKTMRLLATGREILPKFMRVCMITSGKVLAAKPDEAVRFLAAEISALRYAVANRDEEIKLTIETTKAKPDDPRPAFIFDEAIKYKDIDPEIGLPMDKLAWTQEMLLKNGSMPKPADLTKVVAPDIRAKALELVK
jgi:NitT/TauT family transport system substrate-binding protein